MIRLLMVRMIGSYLIVSFQPQGLKFDMTLRLV